MRIVKKTSNQNNEPVRVHICDDGLELEFEKTAVSSRPVSDNMPVKFIPDEYNNILQKGSTINES